NHLHVSFGDAGVYAVTADAAGLVQLGSKTGSGLWVTVSPAEAAQLDGTIGSGKIHSVALSVLWGSPGTPALAGRMELSLKDDDPNTTTPFIVDLGDQANPGFKLNCTTGTVERFQAAFVPGTSGGQSRASFSFAGGAASISLGGLFFLYDGQKDEIGIGGTAQMTFGKDSNKVNLILGNPAQDQAGLLIQNGVVQSFNGRFIGSFLV